MYSENIYDFTVSVPEKNIVDFYKACLMAGINIYDENVIYISKYHFSEDKKMTFVAKVFCTESEIRDIYRNFDCLKGGWLYA